MILHNPSFCLVIHSLPRTQEIRPVSVSVCFISLEAFMLALCEPLSPRLAVEPAPCKPGPEWNLRTSSRVMLILSHGGLSCSLKTEDLPCFSSLLILTPMTLPEFHAIWRLKVSIFKTSVHTPEIQIHPSNSLLHTSSWMPHGHR